MDGPPSAANPRFEARSIEVTDDERMDAAVVAALDEVGIDASFARTVRGLLLREDEQWRVCCGSGCDPCVETLARAIAAARRRLEEPGKG